MTLFIPPLPSHNRIAHSSINIRSRILVAGMMTFWNDSATSGKLVSTPVITVCQIEAEELSPFAPNHGNGLYFR